MAVNIVIPMAGRGSRFYEKRHENSEYSKPKPLISVAGQEMIKWAVSSFPLKEINNLIFLVLKEHVDNFKIDEYLKKIFGDFIKIVIVDEVTEGAACTVLLAKDLINNGIPLLIADSDIYIDGYTIFQDIELNKDNDGLIAVFESDDPKYSFSKINDEGYLVQTAEKNPISNNANIGSYFFSYGRDFVSFAEEMIKNKNKSNNEYYVAPVYNYLIKSGKKIKLSRPKFAHSLGTPEDLKIFIHKLKLNQVELPIKR